MTFNTILNNGVTATSPYLTLNDSSVVSNDGVVTPASITSGTDYSFTISATSSVGRVGSGTTKIFNVYATLSAAPSSTGGRITPVSTQISRDQTNALK
ncbi:MAG: hypothetical protein ORO03_08630 [Alphaproteobacteria bacterium]|nr:hypothetical protein [Alphaproteobacteria bacterium]